MAVKRILLLALVMLGLAPGTFVRTHIPPADTFRGVPVQLTPIPAVPTRLGPFTLTGAWQISTPDPRYGGYSALVEAGNGDLIAGSDAGLLLHIRMKNGAPAVAYISNMVGFSADQGVNKKHFFDLEALTRDPETGQIWAAFEQRNIIARYDAHMRPERRAQPEAMQDWSSNAGAEALVRLSDGEFIAIEESGPVFGGPEHRAILFNADPTDNATATRFTFVGLKGYRPVDAAAMADGKILVLMRNVKIAIPLQFSAVLVMFDPAQIRPGGMVRAELLATIREPLPRDNFEGMALTHETSSDQSGGQAYLWLISDNNLTHSQRTLLLKLRINQ